MARNRTLCSAIKLSVLHFHVSVSIGTKSSGDCSTLGRQNIRFLRKLCFAGDEMTKCEMDLCVDTKCVDCQKNSLKRSVDLDLRFFHSR